MRLYIEGLILSDSQDNGKLSCDVSRCGQETPGVEEITSPRFGGRTDTFWSSGPLALGSLTSLVAKNDTRTWLDEKHGIVKDTEARDIYDPEEEEMRSDPISSMVGKSLFSERLRLDEVISLWHPQSVIMVKSAGPVEKQEYPKNDMTA